MRKLLGITIFFLLASLAAAAEDSPKAEVFGGYQYSRQQGSNLNGWNAALTRNLNHWFGATADFSGAYLSQGGVGFRSYTYTFGPTIASRSSETFTPFAHALFGGFHQSADLSGSSLGTSNGFAMIFGGGVDAALSRRLAVRVGQFDFMSFHTSGASSNIFRFSAGIVFHP
jgi:hypothetical protein